MATNRTTPKRKETEVVIPDGTQARVSEKVGDKTVTYNAEIKEKESDTDTENDRGGSDDVFENLIAPLPFDIETENEPRQTPLENMFEKLRYAVDNNGLPDSFYANVIRLPDSIGDVVNYPCNNSQMDLGVFRFTTRDRFNFVKEIQKLNHNSGGMFSIAIYGNDNKPLTVMIHQPPYRERFEHKIFLQNFAVPNPDAMLQPETPNNANGGLDLITLMREERQANETRFNQLLSEVNRRKEKSTIEQAFEQKMIQDVLNPPKKETNFMDEFMMKFMLMPEMLNGMREQMFQRKDEPKSETGWEKALKLLEAPPVANAVDGIMNIIETASVAKLTNQMPPTNQNGFVDTDAEIEETGQPQQNPMQELVVNLITELESDRPLTLENEFIVDLSNRFPQQREMLIETCKEASFAFTSKQLLNFVAGMNDSPLVAYLDIEQTQAQGKYVWNERGDRLMIRLEEFYNFARSI